MVPEILVHSSGLQMDSVDRMGKGFPRHRRAAQPDDRRPAARDAAWPIIRHENGGVPYQDPLIDQGAEGACVKWLISNWKPLLCAMVLLLAATGGWHEGSARTDAVWQARWDQHEKQNQKAAAAFEARECVEEQRRQQ